MKKPIIGALAALVIIAAAAIYYVTRHTDNGHDKIKVSGNIEVTTADVSFKVPGRVQARLVDEGEVVKAGQLIARLDSADFAHEVAIRKAEVQTARGSTQGTGGGVEKGGNCPG